MKSDDDALFSHFTYLVLMRYLANRKLGRQRIGALCGQYSSTSAAVSICLS